MEKVKVFHNGERVWSADHVRNNTFFGPYQGNIDIMASRILNIQEPAKQLQEKDKTIDLHIETDEQIWLQIVPGALCKWDPTMEMIRGPDNEIYLRTTRDVMPREELRAWFSPSLERELGISKNNMDVKTNGIGQQCPTCDMINHRSLFTTQTLLRCETDEEKVENHKREYEELTRNSSFPPFSQSSTSSANYHRVNSPSFEIDSNLHHNLHSAFRRLANNTFQPFEDPKLARLISSFSEPRHLKDTSSETLADHHKKEFRKKFQGNEHYLRKHLYREGLSERSVNKFRLTKFSDKEHTFLTSITVQQPLKYENLERNYHSNTEFTKNGDPHQDNLHPRELDMAFCGDSAFSHLERKKNIWTPYRSFPKDFTPKPSAGQRYSGLKCVSSLEQSREEEKRKSDKQQNVCGNHEGPRDIDFRVTFHGSDSTHSSKCKARKQSSADKETAQLNEEAADHNRKELNKPEVQNNEKKVLKFQNADSTESVHVEQDSNVEQNENRSIKNTEQRAIIPRYCLTAQRPWVFPNPSFLSSITRTELAQYHDRVTALSMASLSRYQHINPFTLPYALSTTPQSTPRPSQGFTCDFCGKVYCRKYVLKIHMRTHTGFKPLKCKFCDKSFSDPSNMKKHVKLHDTENTVHKCKHCGRNFVRYRGLLNHIKSKHTEPLNIGMII